MTTASEIKKILSELQRRPTCHRDELFLYLGRLARQRGALHVWFHVQALVNRTIEAIKRASAEIYPTMIHESMIQDGDSVLVFDLRNDATILRVTPVHISHDRFPRLCLSADDVRTTYRRALAASRSPPYLVIGMEFHADNPDHVVCCKTYEPTQRLQISHLLQALAQPPGLSFAPLEEYLCVKNIPYL
jgi:hypothetical protein